MTAELFDHEIERRLPGGLLDGGDIATATDLLQATDFHQRHHQHILGAIIGVYRAGAGAEISPATVLAELRRAGQSDIPITVLEALCAEGINNYASSQIVSYIETIRDLAQRRDLERTLVEIAHLTRNLSLTSAQVLDRAQH